MRWSAGWVYTRLNACDIHIGWDGEEIKWVGCGGVFLAARSNEAHECLTFVDKIEMYRGRKTEEKGKKVTEGEQEEGWKRWL